MNYVTRSVHYILTFFFSNLRRDYGKFGSHRQIRKIHYNVIQILSL